MYSKQEKLAAARRKLKEFQGKQRENDFIRYKNSNSPASETDQLSKMPVPSTTSYSKNEACHMGSNSPRKLDTPNDIVTSSQEDNVRNSPPKSDASNASVLSYQTAFTLNNSSSVNSNIKPIVNTSSSEFVYQNSNSYDCNIENNDLVPSSYLNGVKTMNKGVLKSSVESFPVDDCIKCDNGQAEVCTVFTKMESVSGTNTDNEMQFKSHQQYHSDPRSFFETDLNGSNFSNMEQNAADMHTEQAPVSGEMSQLIEEKNNLLQVLKRTEEVLKYTADQKQYMAQSVTFLQQRVKDLEEKLLASQNETHRLQLQSEQLCKQKDIDNAMIEEFRMKLDFRDEQFIEIQQKLELKTKECDELCVRLQETQSHLSASLIKVQQLSVGEQPELNSKFTELQMENAKLTQSIQDLQRNLETLIAEKEQSSHNFHTYAQQCNTQISTLSSQVRDLMKENHILLEKNKTLETNVKELETLKKENNADVENPEMVDLLNKLKELTDENRILQIHLKEKAEDMEELQREKKEKNDEIKQIEMVLQDLKLQNVKLLQEREHSTGNEKLLAAMESDKVAASRAMSQNQRLKEQVAELEEGFIKLSHEKLQLTDELAHERHLKKELELRLEQLKTHDCHDDDHHDCDHDHHHRHESDGTTNESADVEELKNIIRQLEDDKTELLARLSSSNFVIQPPHHVHENDVECLESTESTDRKSPDTQDEDPPNSKLLLQQMEEKVKRTMAEIAALDEEKEKLEHLVLQLQGETETIGEYVTLYQTQRMLLRQRNKEKDEQLLQLSKDKEELKSKLTKLNDLVNHLLSEKGIENKEREGIIEVGETAHPQNYPEETAAKIQTLITEIQSTNLIDNQTVAFHHCPCCSGRLITI